MMGSAVAAPSPLGEAPSPGERASWGGTRGHGAIDARGLGGTCICVKGTRSIEDLGQNGTYVGDAGPRS
jgi:hypothetical protein